MKAAVRINSLTLGGVGPRTLPAMEAHGKREDSSSRKRQVRDMAPLVHGTLDLRQAFDAHVKGCRMNGGLKRPVLHAVVQFPPQLGKSAKNRQTMLDLAVRFINDTHGGDAVFAARLDQDEEGLATVDVFFAPKYEKVTKRGSQLWISTSKHGKDLAEKHRAEIERRNKGVFSTAPRHVGIALQAELYDFLAGRGLKLTPRNEKAATAPDRIEPEVHKARRAARRKEAEAVRKLEAAAESEAAITQLRAQLGADREAAAAARAEAEFELQRAVEMAARQREIVASATEKAAKEAAIAAAEIIAGVVSGRPPKETAVHRQIWPTIQPIANRLATWWQQFRPMVMALRPVVRPESPPDFRTADSEDDPRPNG